MFQLILILLMMDIKEKICKILYFTYLPSQEIQFSHYTDFIHKVLVM